MIEPSGNLMTYSNTEHNKWHLKKKITNTDLPLICVSDLKLPGTDLNDHQVPEPSPIKIQNFDTCTPQQIEYLERHKYDYICGVLTTRRTECRRSLCCKTHSYNDKLLVPRTLPFEDLYKQEQVYANSFKNIRAVIKKYFNHLDSQAIERPIPSWSYDRTYQGNSHSHTEPTSSELVPDFMKKPRSKTKPGRIVSKESKSTKKMEQYLLNLAKNTNGRESETVSYLHYKLRPFYAMEREEQETSVLAKFGHD